MRFAGLISCGLLLGLSGCQCCPGLTEHYACAVDAISDHEYAMEWLYVPAWDLNRIGRSDWCNSPGHRLACRRVCDRTKPAACGHVVSTERYILTESLSTPEWSLPDQPPSPADPPTGMPALPERVDSEIDILEVPGVE